MSFLSYEVEPRNANICYNSDMKVLVDTYRASKHLHHAYIIEGIGENVHPQICQFCEKELSVSSKGNPDFIYEEKDKFLIDDARRLRELQLNKSSEKSGRKIFIISFNFITREAQNSLLKVLEEPTDGTHIFIITPSIHVFLPTVLSRVTVISGQSLVINGQEKVAKEFLKLNEAERLKKIAKLVKDIKDEKASKSDAIQLVRSLEQILHQDALVNKKRTKEDLKKLAELEKVASYLHDQGASVKMLLEHVALIV